MLERGRFGIRMAWRKSAAFMPMIAALLLAPGAPHLTPADAASCPNLISACGCVIASPGIYLAANTLVASASNQTCIEITSRASGAILNLNGFNMFGSDGTGTGILIDKGASRVIVEGGIESGSGTAMAHDGGPAEGPPCGAAVAGQAQVSRWNIGIEDDGDDAIIALFSSVGGVFALPRPTPGNTSAGVMLNGVRNSFVGDLQADYNQSGLVVRDSTDVSIANFTSCFNTVDGLDLVSAIGTTVGPGGCESNGRYGVHLVAASRTTIHD